MSMNRASGSPRSCDEMPVGRAMFFLLVSLLVIAIVLALSSCAKKQPTKVPTYEQAKSQALAEGPLGRPPVEVRKKLKCDGKAVAVKKGPGVPFTGVLVPNPKAACLKAQVAERDRLRTEAEGRELQLRTSRIIRDAGIKALAEKAQRSWWEQYQWAIMGPLIFILGATTTIAIVQALTGGKGIITTQTHVLPKLQGAHP